jgi:hypothetical protein
MALQGLAALRVSSRRKKKADGQPPLRVSVVVSTNVPALLSSDPEQLGSAIMNGVSNAVKVGG